MWCCWLLTARSTGVGFVCKWCFSLWELGFCGTFASSGLAHWLLLPCFPRLGFTSTRFTSTMATAQLSAWRLCSSGACMAAWRFSHVSSSWLTAPGLAPNNSFHPNPLRSTNTLAGRACHFVGSTTQVGLNQEVGRRRAKGANHYGAAHTNTNGRAEVRERGSQYV